MSYDPNGNKACEMLTDAIDHLNDGLYVVHFESLKYQEEGTESEEIECLPVYVMRRDNQVKAYEATRYGFGRIIDGESLVMDLHPIDEPVLMPVLSREELSNVANCVCWFASASDDLPTRLVMIEADDADNGEVRITLPNGEEIEAPDVAQVVQMY